MQRADRQQYNIFVFCMMQQFQREVMGELLHLWVRIRQHKEDFREELNDGSSSHISLG